MVILPGIRVIVRRFLCIERRFLSDWSKKFYVDVLAQCGSAHFLLIDLIEKMVQLFVLSWSIPAALGLEKTLVVVSVDIAGEPRARATTFIIDTGHLPRHAGPKQIF